MDLLTNAPDDILASETLPIRALHRYGNFSVPVDVLEVRAFQVHFQDGHVELFHGDERLTKGRWSQIVHIQPLYTIRAPVQ